MEQKNFDTLGALLALLLLMAGFYGYSKFLERKNAALTPASVIETSWNGRVNESVNLHLRQADQTVQLQQLRQSNDLAALQRQTLDKTSGQPAATRPVPLYGRQEVHAVEVTKEIQRRSEFSRAPADQIDHRLSVDQFTNDYDSKYQTEYVKEFVRNARANGVEVEVDENLNVVDVRRAPNSLAPNDFGGDAAR
jgi:hypothetical protein